MQPKIKFFLIPLTVISFLVSIFSEPKLKLELEDVYYTQGKESKSGIPVAYLNEKFRIKVTVSGARENASDVRLDGLDKLNLNGKSQSTSIIMNNNSFSAQNINLYDVRADRVGEFEIGPAIIRENGKNFESAPKKLKFKVVERKGESSLKRLDVNNGSSDYDLFCKQSLSDSDVVAGQAVTLKVDIYASGKILKIGIDPPKFEGFLSKEIEQVSRRQEDVGGKMYSVIEKRFILFPIDSGYKKISPVRVNFEVPVKKHKKRGFGFFNDDFPSFFGRGTEIKETFSQALELQVRPLPEYAGSVDGVGLFDKFSLSVDKKEVTVNEPIVLKVEVEGRGNLDQIVSPKLRLPNFFSTYKSKTDVVEDFSKGFSVGKKIFEYVLQVGKQGDWEIASQEFVYFDTGRKTYKVLRSNPIKLKINPPPAGAVISSENNLDHGGDEKDVYLSQQKEKYKKDINFIEEHVSFLVKPRSNKMPLWLFVFLFVFPILFFYKGLWETFVNFAQRNIFLAFFKKKEIYKFRKDFNKILKSKRTKELYPFFFNYFSKRFNVSKNAVSQDWIEKKLLNSGWDSERVDNFLDFLSSCASLSFFSEKELKTDEIKKLLEKGRYWFFMLDSCRFK